MVRCIRVNKIQLIKEVSGDTGFNKELCEKIINSVLDNISYELSRGNNVNLSDFGVFTPKQRKKRMGRNPHTGEFIPIPARIMPVFKAGKRLKEVVSGDK